MDDLTPQFQIKSLKRAEDSDQLRLYRAALEWDLIDPIIIEKREDFKSEIFWKDKIEPFNHQVSNLISFCRRLPVTLLADDVGLGKTISAGLVASELMARGRLTKMLIVCPKILREQWQEELDTKFGIKSVIVTGRELIDAQPPNNQGAVITTYQSAQRYLDFITDTSYEMLVLDEAHKLRNLYGVDPPPKVAVRFKKALSDRLFKYVLMLTATPIQNRLWDLYSLVDLLTVARGHENPFGSEGVFARKFISDSRNQARHLNPSSKDEFRSIVYGYMSRVRRGDAKLHFPERIVQQHTVLPTPEELELIDAIAEPIQLLNPFIQIIILQALISSPEALVTLLNGMAHRGTAPVELYDDVKIIASKITKTAKLRGLHALVDELRKEKPDTWRMVVFTRWRETQTTIQIFLEELGITCGLINGDSSVKNQNTIARFKREIPDIHVIISTEAGSEGVNLQAANVLVNYDLPWNPMIVEQRIGRIQRLASNHASVCIFNIVLKGTFEEYIVGTLMEKLQMASQAIGDVDALLEASGMDEESGANSFEEKIRQLVVTSLAGKNVDEATRKAEKSISDAKYLLETERKNIDNLLGGTSDYIDRTPKSPQLPETKHTLDDRTFVLEGLKSIGVNLQSYNDDIYISEFNGKKELVRFDNIRSETKLNGISNLQSTFYSPGSVAFERLVNKISASGLHLVNDADTATSADAEAVTKRWVEGFQGDVVSIKTAEVQRKYTGKAFVRVRITVAHDSYERLIEVNCAPEEHTRKGNAFSIDRINDEIENPQTIGISTENLIERAKEDIGVSEFCRFYLGRRDIEMQAAGSDDRKRKKIEDDFTPRLEFSLVGLEGKVFRNVIHEVNYKIGGNAIYNSTIHVVPSSSIVAKSPTLVICQKTSKSVPIDCTEKCAITNKLVLNDFLITSEISNRRAMDDFLVTCSVTGKKVLQDEVELSDVTGNPVIRSEIKKSLLSGKKGEPEYFERCDFTQAELLKEELVTSEISNRKFRVDQKLQSTVSGKIGHKSEFINCAITNNPIVLAESEKCEVTGKSVMIGILEECAITHKKVIPSELEKSSESAIKALKQFFVTSSISDARVLEQESVKSVNGRFCVTREAKSCNWSSNICHPDDLITCQLTGLKISTSYLTDAPNQKLETLFNLLNGISRKSENHEMWETIKDKASLELGNKSIKIEASEVSPDKKKIAVSIKVSTMLGLKIRHASIIYSIPDNSIVGKVSLIKRDSKSMSEL